MKKIGTKLYKEIIGHPNVKNPVIWASWLVPMIIAPIGRFYSDDKREKSDRLGLSIELFSLYAVGTALYFSFNPIAGMASKRLFNKQSQGFHDLFSGISGSVASSLYTAFGANKVADWFKKKPKGTLSKSSVSYQHKPSFTSYPPKAIKQVSYTLPPVNKYSKKAYYHPNFVTFH